MLYNFSLLITNRNRNNNTYTPTQLRVTASFFDTQPVPNEYISSFDIFPSYSAVGNLDYMYYVTSSTINDSSIEFYVTNGDGNDVSSSERVATKDLVVRATFTDPNTNLTNIITETFYIVSDGLDGVDSLVVSQTNPTHTFPASASGEVYDYSNSGTTIEVFEGTSSLQFTGSNPQIGYYTVVTGSSNITVGSISADAEGNLSASNHNTFESDVDNASITYTLTGFRLTETPFTRSLVQTFTKARAGQTGSDGSDGVDGKVVSLSSTKYVITYDGDGKLSPDPQTFILSGSAQGFIDPQYRFFSGSTEIQEFSGSSNITVSSNLPQFGQSIQYEVQVKESGSNYDGVFDTIDIYGVKEGSNAFTVFLTNEFHSFPANSEGTVNPNDLPLGSSEVRFFRGGTQYSYSTSGGENTYTASIEAVGIKVSESINNNQIKFTPTETLEDSGSVTLTISSSLSDGTPINFDRVYTFSKSKAGLDGKILNLTSDYQVFLFDDESDEEANNKKIRIFHSLL